MINNEESFPRCFFSHKKENALFYTQEKKKFQLPIHFFHHMEKIPEKPVWNGVVCFFMPVGYNFFARIPDHTRPYPIL